MFFRRLVDVSDPSPLQLGLRSIWEKYYEEAHAVLYVVDAACQNRFEDVKNALGELDYPIPFLHVARMDLVGHCWWLVHVCVSCSFLWHPVIQITRL